MTDLFNISIKGKIKGVPAFRVNDVTVIVKGHFIKTATIFDEYWLSIDNLPDPNEIIQKLSAQQAKPDLFSFAQRIPDVEPKYAFYTEWDNIAVLPITTYEHWLKNQIPSMTRRNIRASEKRGVEVRVAEYNEDYINGIMSIYNETSIRQGRRFWHFGKPFQMVKEENGTYLDRSTFLAAYCKNEIIGYLKLVWDKHTAAIMQVLSKVQYLDCRPNNALISEAVKQCCMRGINYMLYEKYVYGNKAENSLTKYKQNNGFIRMDVPRYYVPITKKGLVAIKFGLHKGFRERVPETILAPMRDLREKWNEFSATKK